MQLINHNNQTITFHGMIFDMDGLIFDSERMFFQHKKIVMQEYGYTDTEENYVKTLGLNGTTLQNKMRELYGNQYPFATISKISRERMMETVQKNGIPVKAGITDLLQFLRQHQIPCVIASSTHTEYIMQYLEKANLTNYFTAIIGGEMVSQSKPEPDIFLRAADAIQCCPSECLVLEDSENGILAAHNANIPVVCIPDMKTPNSSYAKLTFDIIDSASILLSKLS